MAAQHGEQDFKLLVQQRRAPAYRIAYSVLGSEADARRISQKAFIRFFKSANQTGEPSAISIQFYRGLIELCIDRKRRGSPLFNPDHSEAAPKPVAEGAVQTAIEQKFSGNLDEALQRLTANQRIAILLQVQEGLSSRELAEVLNCSENTARVHTYRAMAALQKLLGNE